MFNILQKTITLPDGKEIHIETGKLARLADGAVVVSCGKAKLLATVCSSKDPREGASFFPLSVDYQEKFASAGKIPGGFLKREGRLSDYEVLICRLVDRVIRPMFNDDYRNDTQIAIQLMSSDPEVMPDALAALAASSALMCSNIPFNGPISEVRVSKIDGELVANPSPEGIEKATLSIIVGANADNISMVEGEMNEVSEEELLEAMKFGHSIIKTMCAVQKEMEAELGKTEKREYDGGDKDEALHKELHDKYYDAYYEVAQQQNASKKKRKELFTAVKNSFFDTLPEDSEVNRDLAKKYLGKIEKDACRNLVLNLSKRLDGRETEEVRPIATEVDYLPSAHGSAIFTRGETQSITTVTLGTKMDTQMIDGAMFSGYNKFMLHYNFPGFATGEVKPNRGASRREIGHGTLAGRAIKKVLPGEDDNPYTIRIVSDILESNGSSSMATVCAGSMALMDAGIKVARPVSGIAMGMISDPETGKYAILSDILGDEDHLGDMDFKVTGTEKGITACQMDIKIDGLSYDVLKEALAQATRGRLHILGEMKKSISEPREDLKPTAPRYTTIRIERELIGAVIGPGGKVVQEIQKETGATVIIEEIDNKGVINVFAADKVAMDDAVGRIQAICAVPEEGKVYDGKVKSVVPFGAFVEFMPGKDGLLHISEIMHKRLETMDGVLEVGEEIQVKLLAVDKKTGKYKLSRKQLLPRPERTNDDRGERRSRRD